METLTSDKQVNGVDKALEEMRMIVNEMVTDALRGSITFEIIKKHLSNMLSEHEAFFQLHGKFESYDFADEYCEAATAARALGRKGDIVNQVQDWMKGLQTV